MKKLKRMHLWLGLIFSVFILIESVTGLMMEEPQWLGGQARHIRDLTEAATLHHRISNRTTVMEMVPAKTITVRPTDSPLPAEASAALTGDSADPTPS